MQVQEMNDVFIPAAAYALAADPQTQARRVKRFLTKHQIFPTYNEYGVMRMPSDFPFMTWMVLLVVNVVLLVVVGALTLVFLYVVAKRSMKQ